jgi:tetratricopeptide (TPR) repeat protein
VATSSDPRTLVEGPLQELVAAVKELHRAAGKPGARQISVAIRDRDDMRDTVSHETISAMLRGGGLPKWVKVECVVRQLAEWAVTGVDADREVRRFHQLWLAASDVAGDGPGPLTGTPAVPPTPLRRDFVAPAPHVKPPENTTGLMISNSPPRAPHFAGRRELLTEIRHRLERGGSPTVLVGLGGVGKTRLAREYVHLWSGEYDLVWWVPAEQSSQAMSALAALSDQLGLPSAPDLRQTVRTALTTLEESSLRWLLVYDNADRPRDLAQFLPAGGGHVLVTSRDAAWADETEETLRVGVFPRAESIEFLREWGVTAPAEDCHALAEQLGDLPLALDQVCAMQTATGMPVSEYIRLFAEHLDELLSAGRRAGSQTTTVTTLFNAAAGRLRVTSAAAAHLLELLAFMAPVPVKLSLLHGARNGKVSPLLQRAIYRLDELTRVATLLGRYGLAQVALDRDEIQVHRLVQLVVRESLSESAARARRLDVHRLLATANPGSPDSTLTWPQHAEIGPHLLPSGALRALPVELRQPVLDQIRYLERFGDYDESARLGRLAVDEWRTDDALGPEHPLTVRASRQLANALRALGSYEESEAMVMDTLDLLRESDDYGEDHPDTLSFTAVAAFHLRLSGKYAEALDFDRRRHETLRRVYGSDDRRALLAWHNYAVNLRLLGDPASALPIDLQILDRLAGAGDPETPAAARNLAWDQLDLGRAADAVATLDARKPVSRGDNAIIISRTMAVALRRLGRLNESLRAATTTYRSAQQRFGPDHHLTLAAIMTYANTLRASGDAVGARSLLTEALDRYRRLFGEHNPLTLAAAANLTAVLRALGQWREAYSIDEATHEHTVRALGPGHPHSLVTAIGLASDMAHHQLAAEAVALGRVTVEGLRSGRGETHPETLACAVNLALDLGEPGDGEHRRAVDHLVAAVGADHPDARAATTGNRLECDIEPPPT